MKVSTQSLILSLLFGIAGNTCHNSLSTVGFYSLALVYGTFSIIEAFQERKL